MSPLPLVVGLLLIAVATVDSIWTTLWVDGHAGPLTSRHTSWTRRLVWRLTPPANHRALSLTGPLVLVSSVALWTLLLWTGWVTMFSADPRSLLHTHQGTPANLMDRIYFTGYTLFTMGNGDFSPQGPWWKLVTAAATLSGLSMLTLSVTYTLTVLQAVVEKRSFAGQVWALGRTPEEFIIHSWGANGFEFMSPQLVSLTEQLNKVGDQHGTYPMLYYYHASREPQSLPIAVAIFNDALAILEHGIPEQHRPAPSALHCARESVRIFLETLGRTYISPGQETAPRPDLDRLRAAGIPVVPTAHFDAALDRVDEHRRLLRGFLEAENRDWPRLSD